jgi:hypothetical protein
MTTPSQVIAAIIDKIEDNLDDIGINQVEEASEDIQDSELAPPYCLVYANFEDAAKVSDGGNPFDIPVTIGVACVSADKKTASESFSEAFSVATEIIKLLPGDFDIVIVPAVDDPPTPAVLEPIVLKCKDVPLRIGVVSSVISSVICFFTYHIDLIYED